MAEIKNWYLICYDISDQKRWRTTFKLLKGYGKRVQLSIFRCRLSQRQLERMRWELEKILGTEDRLLVTTLCKSCVAKMIVRNSFSGWDDEQPKFTVI